MNIKKLLAVFTAALAFALPLPCNAANQAAETQTNVEKLKEKPIVVVITSYNNKEWYKSNLDELFAQKYDNYRVIYVDDVSTDGTPTLVKEYVKEKKQEHRFKLIANTERIGQLGNIDKAVSQCDKKDIIVSYDGDDWFPHDKVLARVNEVYADPNVWLTYGQFVFYPSNQMGFVKEVPKDVIDRNDFRNTLGISHLRTFYAGLFQKIKKEDMLMDGKYYSVACDVAFMTPMCEMAGHHIKFIPEVLYVYNYSNPLSDFRVHESLQLSTDRIIRAKERYLPIDQF